MNVRSVKCHMLIVMHEARRQRRRLPCERAECHVRSVKWRRRRRGAHGVGRVHVHVHVHMHMHMRLHPCAYACAHRGRVELPPGGSLGERHAVRVAHLQRDGGAPG